MTTKDPFAGMSEVKSSFVQWGAIGDWVKGTLVSVREVDSRLPGKEGEKQNIYEILAAGGSFHAINEDKTVAKEATTIEAGAYWNVGGKPAIDNAMRNIKVGQIIGFRFAEEKKSTTKGFNATKVIKVIAGGMDPEYKGQDSSMSEVEADEE